MRSQQKTGTNEEVDQFIQDMDEVVVRWDQSSVDPIVREQAVEKAKKLEADGLKVRDDTLRGLVRKRDEAVQKAREDGESPPPLQKKAKKNETARRVDAVITEMEEENKKGWRNCTRIARD